MRCVNMRECLILVTLSSLLGCGNARESFVAQPESGSQDSLADLPPGLDLRDDDDGITTPTGDGSALASFPAGALPTDFDVDPCDIPGRIGLSAFALEDDGGMAVIFFVDPQQIEIAKEDDVWISWDFGDGEGFESEEPLAAHTYAADGEYAVSVSVETPAAEASYRDRVTITTEQAFFGRGPRCGHSACSLTACSSPHLQEPCAEFEWSACQ